MKFVNFLNESISVKSNATAAVSLAIIKPVKKQIIEKIQSEFDQKVKDLFFVELEKIDINNALIHVSTIFTVPKGSQYKSTWYFPICVKVKVDLNDWKVSGIEQCDKHFPEGTVDDQEYKTANDLIEFMNSKYDLIKF